MPILFHPCFALHSLPLLYQGVTGWLARRQEDARNHRPTVKYTEQRQMSWGGMVITCVFSTSQ